MDAPPAIETRSLQKVYGRTVAVTDLSMTVPEGTIYGFLGPNGAGKTTTMRLLTSLVEPTSGTASVAGRDIRDREQVSEVVGYLPEDPPVYPELTGREQLAFAAGLDGIDADDRAEELLQRFGLAEAADQRVSTYSRGMEQKLGLIQAMLDDPEVLLLDEPTAGLDPRAARIVRETIADIADDGTTVVLSTHVLPVVEKLADRVGVLQDGRLVAEGHPEELTRRAEAGEDADLEDVFIEVTRSRPPRA